MMKILSWNLNGLIATLNNGSLNVLDSLNADIICLQEIRTNHEPVVLDGQHHFWNHSEREGYSGTAVIMRDKPIRVVNGFLGEMPDDEGRLITVELHSCYLVNVYVPNSQHNLKRHAYRRRWDQALYEHVSKLLEDKPVIICGDFNVARHDLDIYEENMRQYWAEQGYASDERSDFETLLEAGFSDVFRKLHPNKRSYTWWSNRLNKRQENRGWRLDYFLVSDELIEEVQQIRHHSEIMGSDHCPIELEVVL